MKINGNGQAKILTPQERELLINKGFLCQRDRTLNEICYYTACRISEARQIRYADVFVNGKIQDTILLRKCTTKGKQASRYVPIHDNLRKSLIKYTEDSQELLKIKKLVGQWDYKSLVCGDVFDEKGRIICRKCRSYDITNAGKSRGKQMYKCKTCLYRFLVQTAFLEHPSLREDVIRLGVYNSMSYGFLFLNPHNPYLFPGAEGNGYLSFPTAKEIFTNACQRVNIVGAGTHSWRRTALTEMHKGKIPLRVIQKISGHTRLKNLQKYLEVGREEMESAILLLP